MKNPARIFFLSLLVLGVLGMAATGSALYVRLVYMSAAVLALSFVLARFSVAGIQIQRHARSLRASVGDMFEETFEVQNTGPYPRLYLEIINESTIPHAAGLRILTWVHGRQIRTYLNRTWLTRRGVFFLGPTTVASGDPFGLFPVQQTFPAADRLLVLPLIIPIDRFTSPLGLLPGGKAIRRKAHEITPHASGLREYAPGDPLKRIHWPSLARRDKLMVKEFEQDPQAEVWIFLDAQRAAQAELPVARDESSAWQDWVFNRRPELTLPPSTLEYGVSIAASLAHYFIARRRAVGFVTGGPAYTIIPAERSLRQEGKIIETLAFVSGDGELPLASLVDLQAPLMPFGSSALLVTPSVDGSLVLATELLQRRNLHPIVILLEAGTFGGPAGAEALAGKLAARNVPVCRVRNGADLRETLSNFAIQPHFQESPL
ncbi:MAG: DUF58 domain-containing protein [Anaerolineales bacterium]